MGNTFPFKRTIRNDLEVPAGVDRQFRAALRQLGAREHTEKRRYWTTAAAAVLSVFAALTAVATVAAWSQGRSFGALSGIDAPPELADWLPPPEGGSEGMIGGADPAGAVFFNGAPVGGYKLLLVTYEAACQYLGGPIRLPALPASTDYDPPLFFTYHPEADGVFPEGPFWVSVQYEISGEPAFAFSVGRGELIDEQALYEQAAQAGLSVKRHVLSGIPVYRYGGKAGTFGDGLTLIDDGLTVVQDGLTLTQTISNVSYCWDQDGLSYSMPPPPGFSDLDTVARIWSMIDQVPPTVAVIAHENDEEVREFFGQDIRLPTAYAQAHGFDRGPTFGYDGEGSYLVQYTKTKTDGTEMTAEDIIYFQIFRLPERYEKLTDWYREFKDCVVDELEVSGETVYRHAHTDVVKNETAYGYGAELDGLVYTFTLPDSTPDKEPQYLEFMAAIIQG